MDQRGPEGNRPLGDLRKESNRHAPRGAFAEPLTHPVPPEVVKEIYWYFRACRDGGIDLDERLNRTLYRRWLMVGKHAIDAVASSVLVDVMAPRVGVARLPRVAASASASPLPGRRGRRRAGRR